MDEIEYIGGPRDGDRERGSWQLGQQLLTMGVGDVDEASALAKETGDVVEMAWHVYVVAEGDDQASLVANYVGLFGARELPG